MFKSSSYLQVRISSYTDDIAIVAASKTLKENCTKLQLAAKHLILWGNSHNI
jgi:hypothetical protein